MTAHIAKAYVSYKFNGTYLRTYRRCELACFYLEAKPSVAIQLNSLARSDLLKQNVMSLRKLFNWIAAHALALRGARLLAMTVLAGKILPNSSSSC